MVMHVDNINFQSGDVIPYVVKIRAPNNPIMSTPT